MTISFLCGDPSRGHPDLRVLQSRARQHGLYLEHGRHSGRFSLIEKQTGRALSGLDSITLAEIARVILELPKPAKRRRKRRANRSRLPSLLKRLPARVPDRVRMNGHEGPEDISEAFNEPSADLIPPFLMQQ